MDEKMTDYQNLWPLIILANLRTKAPLLAWVGMDTKLDKGREHRRGDDGWGLFSAGGPTHSGVASLFN